MSKRLSPERIAGIQRNATRRGCWPASSDDMRDLLSHIDAIEAELASAKKTVEGMDVECVGAMNDYALAKKELTEARAEIARLTQQLASRDAEIEGRLRGVR